MWERYRGVIKTRSLNRSCLRIGRILPTYCESDDATIAAELKLRRSVDNPFAEVLAAAPRQNEHQRVPESIKLAVDCELLSRVVANDGGIV
jgi:hypothetical protein